MFRWVISLPGTREHDATRAMKADGHRVAGVRPSECANHGQQGHAAPGIQARSEGQRAGNAARLINAQHARNSGGAMGVKGSDSSLCREAM